MKANERLQALRILCQLLDKQIALNYSISSAKNSSNPRLQETSPFAKELCFGVCRHYYRLELLADSLLKKRPKSTEVWVCLLLGLYQLHYLNIADYAVVKESVGLLSSIKAVWAKGLVNAVLREYCRERNRLVTELEGNLSYQYGHPQWLVSRLKKDWPDHWKMICLANDERPPMNLRVNERCISRENYLKSLSQAGIEATPSAFSNQGIQLRKPCNVHDLPGFSEGHISVQDEAAQLAASLLDLTPGLRVLDACCAPGGKTCHILEMQPDISECVALDIDGDRLKRVKENLTRLKLNATVIAGDAQDPSQWWDGKLFDRILLDAPCSAMGVIRRHPDIKLLRTEKDIRSIAALQHELIKTLWPLLAPGGRLVYATCSVLPLENDEQIANFCHTQKDSRCLSVPLSLGHHLKHGLQIFPGEHGMDGFFYSILQKMV